MNASRLAAPLLVALSGATPAWAVPHEDRLGSVTSSVSPAFVPPRLLEGGEPQLSEGLRAGRAGTIDLDLVVGSSGRVESVRLVHGLGGALDEAATRAAEAFVFVPARYGGAPVPCTVRWHFHLGAPPRSATTLPERGSEPALAHTATAGAARARSSGAERGALTPVTLDAPPAYRVTVRDRPLGLSASSFTIEARELRLRPHARPADVLAAAPGLYAVQHAGGGKATQYFLRGFDADHGTDLAFRVDGVPMNLPSHGHGQGYADLNGVIPETIERVELQKGPYEAAQGDFATAGSVELVTRREVAAPSITLGAGGFDTLRALVLASPEVERAHTLVAAEAYTTNGPYVHAEQLRRYSALARLTHDVSPNSSASLAVTSYGAGWNASGQLPDREVRAGRLDRFGALDPTEGGASQRHAVQGRWGWRGEGGDEVEVMGYLAHGRFRLYSNFTFFSADPVHGDMIEQEDVRTFGGLEASYASRARLGEVGLSTRVGVELRAHTIENALHHAVARERLSTSVQAQVLDAAAGAYAREDITWTPWLRTVLGLRADARALRVTDQLTPGAGASSAGDALVSPKASLILTPVAGTSLYANLGYGFHSNDARGVVLGANPASPLVRARGYELGARTRLLGRVELSATLFRTDLDGELVWVGDEGTTEARGPTRRTGVEAELRLRLLDWLWVEGDLTLAEGRFVDSPAGADAVPLAPRFVASAGLSAEHPSGWYGRLGALRLAERPATEDGFITAAGFTRVDLTAGYKHERFELGLSVQNLLDTQWNEAQFATVSRLPGERSATSCPAGTRASASALGFAGCEDLHFTPGAPLNAQANATLYF